MKMISSLTIGAALFVTACSSGSDTPASDASGVAGSTDKADDESTVTPVQTGDVPTANTEKGTHPGGDAIELVALGEGDVPELDGEIGCSFSVPEAKQPLLIAKGNVDAKASVFGVYKVGDSVERIGGRPGGFDKLSKGMQLSGKGMTLDIAPTSAQSNAIGNESSSHPATLTLNRADGGKRVYTGKWNCGP